MPSGICRAVSEKQVIYWTRRAPIPIYRLVPLQTWSVVKRKLVPQTWPNNLEERGQVAHFTFSLKSICTVILNAWLLNIMPFNNGDIQILPRSHGNKCQSGWLLRDDCFKVFCVCFTTAGYIYITPWTCSIVQVHKILPPPFSKTWKATPDLCVSFFGPVLLSVLRINVHFNWQPLQPRAQGRPQLLSFENQGVYKLPPGWLEHHRPSCKLITSCQEFCPPFIQSS